MKYTISIDVECDTQEQAEQVAAERLNVDEDYGFPYQFQGFPAVTESGPTTPPCTHPISRVKFDGGMLAVVCNTCNLIVTNLTKTPPAHQPKLEVLVVRDPDMLTDTTMYVDGVVATDYVTEDVDPGAGYTGSDWDERTADIEAADYSPAFKAAVLESRRGYDDSKYIDRDY